MYYNVLYYQYMDLFSYVSLMLFSYLITKLLVLKCLY